MADFVLTRAQAHIFDAYEIASNVRDYAHTAERHQERISPTHVRRQAEALIDLLMQLDASAGNIKATTD